MTAGSRSGPGPWLGPGGLLAVVFIALKLSHGISWSWWWVLSPLWIGAALALASFVMLAAALAIAASKGNLS